MPIKKIKERHQTGENWILYEMSLPSSWDWPSGLGITFWITSDGEIV